MRPLRPLPRRLPAALLLVVPLLAGCHSWRPTTVAPQEVIAEQRPRTVRVTLSDGSLVTMSDPMVVVDSIVGSTDSGTARIPAADVRALEVERLSATRTLALVVGYASTIVTVIAVIIAFQPHYSGF